jgi:deoxyribodipyrimidine photo-lyase
MTSIVWFRQDLRLADNPALDAALKRGEPIIPLYIWAPEDDGDWPPGAASRWWLHQSLNALDGALRKRGSRLILAKGSATSVLPKLAARTRASAVYWNRRYEPAAMQCSQAVEKRLASQDIQTASFNSALLAEPWDVVNLSGKPYRVYTPYMRRLIRDLDPPLPLRAPAKLRAPLTWPASASLGSLDLMPRIKWYEGMAERWRPGEPGAHARLERFISHRLTQYKQQRDRPAMDGTSGLSPHLHFGEIGPRQIWHALGAKGRTSTFLHELIWREFAYHLLYHFPETTTKPLRAEFASFPWKKNTRQLKAWQRGRTGVPMVDAGMREQWVTGVMHNRVRMIVASFLVKNLLQPWQEGTRWFWDTLVDADLASNTLNWQWVAGSGADAAPYFRIFNPVTQGERYDPDGEYVRRWVPELAGFANHAIHSPWRKSKRNPQPAPEPLVDLNESREAALDAYADMRRRAKAPAQWGRTRFKRAQS